MKYQKELARLQNVESLHTGNRFWRAWKDLQALETALKQFDPSLQHHGFIGRLANRKLRHIVLFALGGGVIAATTVFGVIGYLSYFSRLRLQEQQLPVFLILGTLGGSIIGSGAGWFAHWYRSRP